MILKLRNLFLLSLVYAFLISCQPEGRLYAKHKSLSPDVEWLKKDIREFKVPIEDIHKSYNLSLSFRYANGYQFKEVKVVVKEIAPSGDEVIKNYSLKIREDNGDYIGEAGYDIWDSEHLIQPDKNYKETGTYTYVLSHDMPQDPLNFAMEIGVVLDEIK